MTIAYFDCCSGISGDMALGALLDCGVPIEALRAGLASIPVSGWQIEAEPILQNGIHALDVTITQHGVNDAQELQVQQVTASAHDHEHHDHHHHDHEHDGHHHHTHEHDHSHEHHDQPPHAHTHGLAMAEIRDIIESSQLSARVKRDSLAIFGRIAAAEAHIHHTAPEAVHFHEIGGIDSLIDICGIAWCLEYLAVAEVHCSALPYSTGFVDCAHGRMPVPAPATLELLKGVPLVPTAIRGEMVTPTGAGLVAALSRGFGPPPAMTLGRVGVGSGKKRFADRPNLLRVLLGERVATPTPAARGENQPDAAQPLPQEPSLAGLEWETLVVIESNIDNMNPEFYNYVFERLFAVGALDVWLQPLQMKKNRPGALLGALCPGPAQAAVIVAMLQETTTLGVRVSTVQRAALPRAIREVDTAFGRLRVKVAHWPERDLWRAAPEYADVERLAAQHGVSTREVYEAALGAAPSERPVAGRMEQ